MPQQTSQYPSWVGLVYVFNLIVGTGALTLPAAFAGAGWLLSTILLVLLCFVSFVTATFVLESVSCANATIEWKRRELVRHITEDTEQNLSEDDNDGEETAILSVNKTVASDNYYHLNNKVELSEIASMYLKNSYHIIFFFAALSIYLYGDLAIYTAASAKTIVNLACKLSNNTDDNNTDDNYDNLCFDSSTYSITKITVYRISVVGFAFCVGPFAYFNVQKTKYLQIITGTIRWTAFLIMLTLASIRLLRHGAQGHPHAVNLSELPALAGSSVYSFMCHHSLPGLIAPIRNKNKLMRKIYYDFMLICVFYLLLSLTGVFAFKTIDVLYSLNFINQDNSGSSFLSIVIAYFLAAFPLFPMSTSFPIIAITLQSNLKHLFLSDTRLVVRRSVFVKRVLFPSLAILPPVVVALITHNLKTLVEITGTYAGVMVQYVVPAFLVLYARKSCQLQFGNRNKFESPFRHIFWFWFVIIWAVLCLVCVTVDFIFN